MVKVERMEFPREMNIEKAREIVEKLKELDVLELSNCFIHIKIVKFVSPIELFLVFGEKYTVDDDDSGSWVSILEVYDNLEELAWFINGL